MAVLGAASAAAVCGCGGGANATSASSTGPRLLLSSPAIGSSQTMPAQFTCTGKDVSPPLQWGDIPPGTAELVLFLLDLGHTERAASGGTQAKLSVAWTVRGLSPTLTGMAAGKLPPRAIVGPHRYSICPPKGGTGEYMFRLYALSSRVSASPRVSELEVFRKINRASSVAGAFVSAYTRPA
jgi:phosphatidylethanolamine-binding protein (PEBP) family uncharacterized protein